MDQLINEIKNFQPSNGKEYFVIGVLGTPAMGKSMIINTLLTAFSSKLEFKAKFRTPHAEDKNDHITTRNSAFQIPDTNIVLIDYWGLESVLEASDAKNFERAKAVLNSLLNGTLPLETEKETANSGATIPFTSDMKYKVDAVWIVTDPSLCESDKSSSVFTRLTALYDLCQNCNRKILINKCDLLCKGSAANLNETNPLISKCRTKLLEVFSPTDKLVKIHLTAAYKGDMTTRDVHREQSLVSLLSATLPEQEKSFIEQGALLEFDYFANEVVKTIPFHEITTPQITATSSNVPIGQPLF